MSRRAVVVSQELADQISAEYPAERTTDGAPSEYDFWAGPISRATEMFGRDFESLPFENDPRARLFTYADPTFGAIGFVGVHDLNSDEITLVDYWQDPDYWSIVNGDPQ